MAKEWIISGLTPDTARSRLEEILEVYRSYGVVVLSGLLREDPDFQHFLRDMRTEMRQLRDALRELRAEVRTITREGVR